MMLEECLLIRRHYESIQWHINTVRPTGKFKAIDGLARQCPRSRSKSNTRRPPSTVHPDRPKNDCTACGTLHQTGECPASSTVVLNVTNKATMPNCAIPKFILPQVHQISIGIQGDLGTAEVEVVEAVDPNVLYMKPKQLILQNI